MLDLGAGTGKLAASLVAQGLHTYAVEPDRQMLAQLRRHVPAAHPLAAGAERIPLPDAAVDAVLVGHAFHWFDRDRALPEIARVLRPGGFLALLWNLRDDAVPWVRRLSGIMALGAQDSTSHVSPLPFDGNPLLGRPVRRVFPHRQRLDADGLVGLVATRAHVATLPARKRDRVLGEVRTLATTDPALAGRADFDLPYLTEVWRSLAHPAGN